MDDSGETRWQRPLFFNSALNFGDNSLVASFFIVFRKSHFRTVSLPRYQEWVANAARAVLAACTARGLDAPLPRLLCEPGRSLVATAGVTLYVRRRANNLESTISSFLFQK